jgi:hypothetical protein
MRTVVAMTFMFSAGSPQCPDWLRSPLIFLFREYWGSFPRVKQLEHAVNHSPPSTARIKNEWSHFSVPPVYLHGMRRKNIIVLLLYMYLFLLSCYELFTSIDCSRVIEILLITVSTCVIFDNLIYFHDCPRSLIDILAEQCSKVYY